MSPALLSQRLRDLEKAGLIVRVALKDEPGVVEYHLTRAGRDAKAVVDAIGGWGQQWVEASLSLQNLDPSLLMWDMRRYLDPTPIPSRRTVIQFIYGELAPARRNWWLIVEPTHQVDLCSVDPGFDVDLYVATGLRTMTEVWLGITTVDHAVAADHLQLTGDHKLAGDMQTWLGLSPFAKRPAALVLPKHA